MDAAILERSVKDRWLSAAIGAGALLLYLLFAMWVYKDIDIGIYDDLPEALRSMMGVPTGADVATLAYGVLFGFTGALTLGGLAVSMGSASIAREERTGTIGLLMANPRSRTQVLVSKLLALLILISAATVALGVVGLVIPEMLGIDIGSAQVGAAAVHLWVNSLFYGSMAAAIGAGTGSGPKASGITAGVMAVSYIAVGVLPIVGFSGAARIFPWYYFDSSQPLVNGVAWRHVTMLAVGTIVLAVVSVVAVNRRDFRGRSVGRTLVDVLRSSQLTRTVADRLAGSTRVSSVWTKTASESQGTLVATALVMFSMMGVLMGPLYRLMDDNIKTIGDSLPKEVLAFAGGAADMGSPEGFYQVETFGLMAPIAVMIVAINVGARALAGEEAGRTIGMLLANPISRRRVVLEKAAAMAIHGIVVSLATFAGVSLGSLVGGLGMSVTRIGAICFLLALLGIVFGSLALAIGAAVGRMKVAVFGSIGVALTAHLLNSFLPLSDRLAPWAKVTPFFYYVGGDPLLNGLRWSHTLVLAVLATVLIAGAVLLFERRDLRQSS